jgi:hypothetical protein
MHRRPAFRWPPLVALLLAAGCAPPTGVILDVSTSDGSGVSALTVSVYGPYRALLRDKSVASPKLPGKLSLYGLPATPLRIAARADGNREAGVAVTVETGKQKSAPLVLSAATADGDHDGVPDPIDNCPTVANPDQANANGSGAGDACRGGVNGDLGPVADLPPSHDLPPPADLSPIADLSHVTGLCPIAGTTLCEDWKVPYPTNNNWLLEVSNPPPAVTIASAATRPFYGTDSVHFNVQPFGASVSFVQSDLQSFNLPSGSFWVRAYIYLPSATLPQESYLLVMEDYGTNYANWHINIGDGTAVQFGDDIGSVSKTSASTYPTDRWFCLEWKIDQVATAGMSASHIYLDGTELADLAVTNASSHPLDANRLVLSTTYSGSSPRPNGTDAWYNQIAVGPSRIGCIN